MAHINRGPGFAHEVIYGEKGHGDASAQFGDAADELAATLRASARATASPAA